MDPKYKGLPEQSKGIFRFTANIEKIEPVNELFSKCFIRILYPGLNPNNVFLPKEVVEEMIPSLYNVPIVGEFIETIEDFKDHGGKIEITSDDIQFIQTTKPYGLVPESTEVSWESVKEADGTIKEYLTCTGYLWTGRYPEAGIVVEEQRPQSMELDEETMEGYWERREGKDVFHVTKATFSALCILGKDVPPAFDSASIGSYYMANPISFQKRLGKLIRELDETVGTGQIASNFTAINQNEGGSSMTVKFNLMLDKEDITYQLYHLLNPAIDDTEEKELQFTIIKAEEDNCIYKEEKTQKVYKQSFSRNEDGELVLEDNQEEIAFEEVDTELKTNYEKLQADYDKAIADYEALKADAPAQDAFNELQTEVEQLKEYKANVERQEKQDVITEFKAILSEEEIKTFEDDINSYSKDDLEAKLALIAFRKGNFNKNSNSDFVPDPIDVDDNKPGWEKIVEKHTQ